MFLLSNLGHKPTSDSTMITFQINIVCISLVRPDENRAELIRDLNQ